MSCTTFTQVELDILYKGFMTVILYLLFVCSGDADNVKLSAECVMFKAVATIVSFDNVISI